MEASFLLLLAGRQDISLQTPAEDKPRPTRGSRYCFLVRKRASILSNLSLVGAATADAYFAGHDELAGRTGASRVRREQLSRSKPGRGSSDTMVTTGNGGGASQVLELPGEPRHETPSRHEGPGASIRSAGSTAWH